jgi:hypothetical protein
MSEKNLNNGLTRRRFVSMIMPACSIACLGGDSVWAWTPTKANAFLQEVKHKFDEEYKRKMTYKDFWTARFREFITLAKALEKEMGKDKLIEFLKKATTEKWIERGQEHAKNSPDNSFKTYVNTFRPPRYRAQLTHEVVVDTDTVFELKVKECLTSVIFRQADAADIGYAYVCFGDYAWAQGFNPKIKMVRDKTLMEGHDYCNHRYIWTA